LVNFCEFLLDSKLKTIIVRVVSFETFNNFYIVHASVDNYEITVDKISCLRQNSNGT